MTKKIRRAEPTSNVIPLRRGLKAEKNEAHEQTAVAELERLAAMSDAELACHVSYVSMELASRGADLSAELIMVAEDALPPYLSEEGISVNPSENGVRVAAKALAAARDEAARKPHGAPAKHVNEAFRGLVQQVIGNRQCGRGNEQIARGLVRSISNLDNADRRAAGEDERAFPSDLDVTSIIRDDPEPEKMVRRAYRAMGLKSNDATAAKRVQEWRARGKWKKPPNRK